jgi:hypothetical protein
MAECSGNNNDDEEFLAERLLSRTSSLVCLNFKVPLRVRQQFKIHAARRNMTMTELLLRLLDDFLAADVDRGPSPAIIKREIKK